MSNLWDGTNQRVVHANGAVPVVKTASETLNWTNVNGGSNSLSAYFELDARAAPVSIRIDANPGIAHNGRKLKVAVNRDDTSSNNFRGVTFTNGTPVERGSLTAASVYLLDRRAGHLVIEVVNGRARINTGASFNSDPPTPSNASLLAILNGWSTGATWALVTGSTTEAFATWLASGSFAPTLSLSARLLLIGGGAGGGGGEDAVAGDGGGGGGAGEYVQRTAFAISPASYPISVGDGGPGQAGSQAATGPANTAGQGSNSSFSTLTALGGGAGGANDTNGVGGGSGGGGGGECTAGSTRTGGASTASAGVGFAGGQSLVNASELTCTKRTGAGGGGSGGLGGAATTTTGGGGGLGVSDDITGAAAFRAAGGGGGGGASSKTGGAGGSSTGGTGGNAGGTAATAGAANTGSGGGGGKSGSSNGGGGGGGKGVFIMRVPLVVAIGF